MLTCTQIPYVMTIVLIVLLLYSIVSVAGSAGIRSDTRARSLCVVYSMSLSYGVIYAWVRYADLDETRDRLKVYVTCQASTGINCGSPPDLLGGGRGLGSMVRMQIPTQTTDCTAGVHRYPRHP